MESKPSYQLSEANWYEKLNMQAQQIATHVVFGGRQWVPQVTYLDNSGMLSWVTQKQY